MMAALQYVFGLLLLLIGCIACALAVYILGCIVVAATKKIKEEVRKDGGTE